MMSAKKHSVLCVVGARPNFMKIAPIIAALNEASSRVCARLLHTGQHYDVAMNHQIFSQLGIPEPDINLEVGSASHAVQTAEIMQRFEPVLDKENPSAVLVVGDVNSTIACALVAVKKGVPVIHVEAGLRSHDRAMPEEINRILTDQISDILFTTERCALDNLLQEGIRQSNVHFVGNVMIDTLLSNLPQAVSLEKILQGTKNSALFSGENGYGVVTLHRPSNVDSPRMLKGLLELLREASEQMPLVFPVHPRTDARIREAGLTAIIDTDRICCLPPQGYLEMLGLMSNACVVMTDSGGIQEETTALGVPCLTLRENTERPITVDEGTNTIVGSDPDVIWPAFQDVIDTRGKSGRVPEYWDGNAAKRIAAVLNEWFD